MLQWVYPLLSLTAAGLAKLADRAPRAAGRVGVPSSRADSGPRLDLPRPRAAHSARQRTAQPHRSSTSTCSTQGCFVTVALENHWTRVAAR